MAVAVVWSAGVLPSNSTPLENPYIPIVTRNVFVLNPSVLPEASVPTERLPVITPNGIMSIFGNVQVLFKVAGNPSISPAREKNYLLGEGQREDDIVVIKIDEKNAVITFNNHGSIQEMSLAMGSASGGLETAPGLAETNPRGVPSRSHFRGNAALASKNFVPGNNGNIPYPSEGGANYGGGFYKNNPADPGLNAASSSPDNSMASMQDSNFSNNGGGSDPNNISDQGLNVSAAEHLANLQMIASARQRMQ